MTHMIPQPKMRILDTNTVGDLSENGKIYTVHSLQRMDQGTTLRVYPLRINWVTPLSYVVMKGEREDTEVNAELLPHDRKE